MEFRLINLAKNQDFIIHLSKKRMKKIVLLGVLISVFNVESQITLTTADFATGGDTVRMSQATDNGYDYAATGLAYNWDFSSLLPNAQVLKDFRGMSNAPTFAQFIFGLFAAQNYQASYFIESTDLPLAQITSFLPITIENIFQYNRKTADSLTAVGYSMKVSLSGNSNDLPIKSDTIETRYDFPLNIGNTHSSRGYTSVDFNPIYDAKWNQHRTRTTTVDGYGSITTPFGTFDVLRIKHDIDEVDSLYAVLPFLGGTWIPLDVPASHEYEWWANNQKEPVLRFKTTEIIGNEVVTSIEYRDIYRGLDAGIDELKADFSLFPNPVVNELTIISPSEIMKIKVINVNGEIVQQLLLDHIYSTTINVAQLPAGTYKIQVESDNKMAVKSFVKR